MTFMVFYWVTGTTRALVVAAMGLIRLKGLQERRLIVSVGVLGLALVPRSLLF